MNAKTFIAYPSSKKLGHVYDLDCNIDGWITNCWTDIAHLLIPRCGHAKPSVVRLINKARLSQVKQKYARIRVRFTGDCNDFMARVAWVGPRTYVLPLCK